MAIETFQTIIRYLGDGTQKNFPIPFLFYEKTNVKIQIKNKDVYRNLAYPADYEVTQFASQQGELSLAIAPLKDEVVAVYLEIPAKQDLSLNNNAQIPVVALEKQLDRTAVEVMILQEEQKRNISVPYADKQTALEFTQELFSAKNTALEQANKATKEADRSTNEANKAEVSASEAKQSELEANNILVQVGIEGEKQVNLAKDEADRSASEVDCAKAWAESPTSPDGSEGAKSAKSWALVAEYDITAAVGLIQEEGERQVEIVQDICPNMLSRIGIVEDKTLLASTEKAGIVKIATNAEVLEGVVDNKAVSAKELKNNKATKDDIIAGIGDKIVTVENLISNKKMFTDWASPSSRYALMSSTGELQIAPANGILYVQLEMSAVGCWGALRVYDKEGRYLYDNGVHPVFSGSGSLSLHLPLAKGTPFRVSYSLMRAIAVKFIYYEGN